MMKTALKPDLKLKTFCISKSYPRLVEKEISLVDYKKTPVKKLREIVKDKGLISDPSKTKKAELLKLLQTE